MAKAEYQRVIFADLPRRAELLRAAATAVPSAPPLRLRIHRNHPFEFIASLLPPFLVYSGRAVECVLSDYDDSLSFALEGVADVELVWLDFDRYSLPADDLIDWLTGRLAALRGRSRAPILVAPSPGLDEAGRAFNCLLRDRVGAIAGVRVPPLDDVAASLGDGFVDRRMAGVGATRLSERANVEIARHMGLCWLPAVLEPRLKAVVFDLDNTLWRGVLGEDGLNGIVMDDGHAALQAKAVALADSGLFLGLLSRNEPADVEAVLAAGRMALPANRISARSISWDSKADGMKAIAEALRIGLDAILFVDDNPGELAAVASACPGIRLLHASDDAAVTSRALDLYPGLFSWGSDAADAVRAADLATNEARGTLRAEAGTEEDYLASLQLVLRVAANPAEARERLQQLSEKTNQFNLSLRRLSDVDVAECLDDPRRVAVGIWLADRFSDSGLIGALFARLDDADRLIVEELCVSCRALGRGTEDAMIVAAVTTATEAASRAAGRPVTEVGFTYETGPRNGPARQWLERFSGQALAEAGTVVLSWNAEERGATIRDLPIRLEQGAPNVG